MEQKEKTMEELQPRTLLKAKDGSEYIVFLYYVDPNSRSRQKKSDTPTELFTGYCYGDNGKRRFTRNVSDYRVADEVDQKFVDTINKIRDDLWHQYREYWVLSKKSEQIAYNCTKIKDSAPKDIQSVINKMDATIQGIGYTIEYTGKDYVKGEVIAKQLEDMKCILRYTRQDIENINVGDTSPF